MPEVDFDVNVTDLYDAIGRSDWNSASVACRIDPVEAETWVVRRRGSVDEDDETSQRLVSAVFASRGMLDSVAGSVAVMLNSSGVRSSNILRCS